MWVPVCSPIENRRRKKPSPARWAISSNSTGGSPGHTGIPGCTVRDRSTTLLNVIVRLSGDGLDGVFKSALPASDSHQFQGIIRPAAVRRWQARTSRLTTL